MSFRHSLALFSGLLIFLLFILSCLHNKLTDEEIKDEFLTAYSTQISELEQYGEVVYDEGTNNFEFNSGEFDANITIKGFKSDVKTLSMTCSMNKFNCTLRFRDDEVNNANVFGFSSHFNHFEPFVDMMKGSANLQKNFIPSNIEPSVYTYNEYGISEDISNSATIKRIDNNLLIMPSNKTSGDYLLAMPVDVANEKGIVLRMYMELYRKWIHFEDELKEKNKIIFFDFI